MAGFRSRGYFCAMDIIQKMAWVQTKFLTSRVLKPDFRTQNSLICVLIVIVGCISNDLYIFQLIAILQYKQPICLYCKVQTMLVNSYEDVENVDRLIKFGLSLLSCQGQFHITRRDICYFVVYTFKNFVTIIIERNDDTWQYKMCNVLTQFYLKALLPEIIDSRVKRNRTIRTIFQKDLV